MRPWETQVRQLRRRANRPQKHITRVPLLPGRVLCRLRLRPQPGGQSNMPEAMISRKTNPRHLRRQLNRLRGGEVRLLAPAPPCLLQMPPQGMPKQVGFFCKGVTGDPPGIAASAAIKKSSVQRALQDTLVFHRCLCKLRVLASAHQKLSTGSKTKTARSPFAAFAYHGHSLCWNLFVCGWWFGGVFGFVLNITAR